MYGSGSILKTTDGGITWNTCLQVQNKSIFSVYFQDADHGWAGGAGEIYNEGVIYKTQDGGSNWVTFSDSINSIVTSFSFINSDTGFATAGFPPPYYNSKDGYIYKTVDGGISWDINYRGYWCYGL